MPIGIRFRPLESAIEKKAVKQLEKKFKAKTFKMNPRGERGWPDRLVLLPNEVKVLIEFKRPGEELRPLQVIRKRELEALGHRVYVCESVEEAVAVCEKEIRRAGRRRTAD